jgi:hypothetical protein
MGYRLALLALLLPGCASASWLKIGKEDFPKADSSNPVVRILAVWQVGEGQNTEGMTTRGFVGQIFLLDAQKQVPVAAEGSVRIYLFDDQGTAEERDRPLHQHDFPVDSWRVRLQKTKMGPAYVLFTPYTRKGAHKAECSLRIKFTPADGGSPVFSDLAPISLPGKSNKPVDPVTNASQPTTSATTAPAISTSSQPAAATTTAAPDKRAFSATTTSLQDALTEARRGRESVSALPVTPQERARIEQEARTRWGDQPRSQMATSPRDRTSSPDTTRFDTTKFDTVENGTAENETVESDTNAINSPSTATRHPLSEGESQAPAATDDEPPRSTVLDADNGSDHGANTRPTTTLARPQRTPVSTVPKAAALTPRCHHNRSLALPDHSGNFIVEAP